MLYWCDISRSTPLKPICFVEFSDFSFDKFRFVFQQIGINNLVIGRKHIGKYIFVRLALSIEHIDIAQRRWLENTLFARNHPNINVKYILEYSIISRDRFAKCNEPVAIDDMKRHPVI